MSVNTLNGQKHVIHFKMNEYNIKLNIDVYGDIDNEHFIILIFKCITLILINKILICELEINLVLLTPLKRMYPSDFQNLIYHNWA